MIELTEELRQAVREHPGEPLRLLDPVTREAFVLLRAEEYDLLKGNDDGSWTEEERDRLRAEALDALGWEGMETNQDEEP
jgi:hypothetical protein